MSRRSQVLFGGTLSEFGQAPSSLDISSILDGQSPWTWNIQVQLNVNIGTNHHLFIHI